MFVWEIANEKLFLRRKDECAEFVKSYFEEVIIGMTCMPIFTYMKMMDSHWGITNVTTIRILYSALFVRWKVQESCQYIICRYLI